MNGSELNVSYLDGHIDIEETQTFHHIPFDVPDGISQLRIQISYNDQIGSDPNIVGGNVLDVGVFDAQGTEAGGDGFRGWSGSNKLDIVIGEDWSTPPYRAGTIQQGIWHMLLGGYKVGPKGLDWSVRVEFDPDPRLPNTFIEPDVRLPEAPLDLASAASGWVRGDLHSHTVFSDGSSYPSQVAMAARAAGLDFYGITDHNRAHPLEGLVPTGPDWPILVPGVEVTTYAGHFNVWGSNRWYDFRNPSEAGLQRSVDLARADGAFVSMNHPKPFGPDWEFPDVTGFDAIEVWNGWWNKLNSVSTRFWDQRLRRGDRVPPLGGSDMHRLFGPTKDDNPFVWAVLGYPTTWVKATRPVTPESIFAAIRRGDIFISESPSGPQIYAELNTKSIEGTVVGGKGDALLAIDQTGIFHALALATEDQTFEFEVSTRSAYVRLELHRATGGIRALTNAFWPKEVSE